MLKINLTRKQIIALIVISAVEAGLVHLGYLFAPDYAVAVTFLSVVFVFYLIR
jgi:hypothetical protein